MNADALTLKVGRMFAAEGVVANVTREGYIVHYGSTAVSVDILEQRNRTLIHLSAPVLLQVPDTPELARWVATDGQRMYFGSAILVPRDGGVADIFLDHTLLGDYLDEEELHNAVGAVLSTADGLDEELQARFGGKRLEDMSE